MKRTGLFFAVAFLLILSLGMFLGNSAMRQISQDVSENKDRLGTIKATLEELQQRVETLEQSFPVPMVGVASWYGDWEERAGNRTANGEIFRKDGFTVAHRTLPFGTVLIIENTMNGRMVPAVVNDRGPYIDGRSMDLTEGLARRLGFIERGLVEVRYYALYTPVSTRRP
jgi:rare lipoprotein A